MDIVGGKVSISGTVHYPLAGRYTGGGEVVYGFVSRDPDGLVKPNRTVLRAGSLEIEISGLRGLPDLIASLVLEQPDGDESPKGFADRLKMRDGIAEAFDQAALRIKQAPRE
ncbi:hypothetical protein [Mesorhizobium sp. KR2-14]|uniref:hypothetical protein n=1 Tax=Mesorhizobium sp. KR2-14 TaxID=3156610 RepID=UPI0032B3369C